MARKNTKTVAEFAAALTPGLGKVPARLVQDLVIGIHKSRSVNLTAISKALEEDIELHATHKRLSRNLARGSQLIEPIADQILTMGARLVHADTPIVVYRRSLKKRYAQRMEYLLPADDDAGGASGYHVCEIVAVDKRQDKQVPLLTSLWSENAPGFVSHTEQILAAIRRVMGATDGRGVVCLDDATVPFEVAAELADHSDYDFIARCDPNLEVIHRRSCQRISELTRDCDTPYGKTLFKLLRQPGDPGAPLHEFSVFLHFGALDVRLSSEGSQQLTLLVLKSRSSLGDDSLGYLTRKGDSRARAALTQALTAHMYVNEVANAHRNHKAQFNVDDFRVLTYKRLQLLVTLLHAVVFYEAELARTGGQLEHRISFAPHEGEHQRDFMPPPTLKSRSKQASS